MAEDNTESPLLEQEPITLERVKKEAKRTEALNQFDRALGQHNHNPGNKSKVFNKFLEGI